MHLATSLNVGTLSRFKAACLITLLLAMSMVTCAHAEVDELVRQARGLLESGKARQAFDLLGPHETARSGDADFDVTLGISSNEIGQFTKAVFALERALTVSPGDSRARAELGRALFALGDTVAAKRVLQEVRQEPIPYEAARTIDYFLTAIERTEEAARSSVGVHVEAASGHDTNINSGQANAGVAVPAFGGLVFTLAPEGVKTADTFYTLAAGISGRQLIQPRWSWINNLKGDYRLHKENDAYDTRQTEFNSGLSYRYDKHEFSAVVQAGRYGVANVTLRQQHGFIGEWIYRLDGFRQLTGYVQTGRLTYPTQRIRDVDRHVIGAAYAHVFSSGLTMFTGVYAGVENERAANAAQLGHRLDGVRTGLQKPLSRDWAAFTNLSFERRKFGGFDPLFLTARTDRQTNLTLGLAWVPARSWRVTQQLAYLWNNSTVVISDFEKQVLSLTVRRDF